MTDQTARVQAEQRAQREAQRAADQQTAAEHRAQLAQHYERQRANQA